MIKAVVNLLLFFTKRFYTHKKAPKSTKKHKKAQKRNQAKAQNVNKRTKIKNALKKHLSGESYLFAYLRFCACKEKSLYNRNVRQTKPVKVLTAIWTKSSLVGPVKKLHCLDELSKLNCQLNCVNDFILLLRCFLCFVLFCNYEILSWKKQV